MAKGTRGRRKSSSEREDDSGSDEQKVSTKPLKDRKKSTTQRAQSGPPQRRRPVRRMSMSDEFLSVSDDDTLKKPSSRRDRRPQRASKRTDSEEDEETTPQPRRRTRKTRSLSPESEPTAPASRRPKKSKRVDMRDKETASPLPQSEDPPDESYEEQLHKALLLSLEQPPSTRPSEAPSEEEQMRWAMEDFKTEAEASARPSSSANAEAKYLRKLKESQDDFEALQRRRAKEAEDIRQSEAHLARVLKESAREEIRTRSWTKNNPRAIERGDKPEASWTSAISAPSTVPAPKSQRAKATKIIDPSSREKKKKTPKLNAVPEDTDAISSSPRPLRTGSSLGNHPQPDKSQAVAIRKSRPIAEATSQALIELREPPIKIEILIAMCERAFPQDEVINRVMKESQKTDFIHRVQYGEDEDEFMMARVIALSLKDKPGEADLSETGVAKGEEAPAYRESAQDKVIDHFKYTSSDYRNEKAGTRKPITSEIWEIMRLYQDFVAWAKGIDPKGKSKEGQLMIMPPTLSSSSTANSSAPAEVNSSLGEITRPSLREDFAVPNAEEANHVMRNVQPVHRAAQRLMQNQSRAIGQSWLHGSRPRARPEAHLRPFGRLPIPVEDNEQVAEVSQGQMAKSTARKVKKNPGYKRSGI
ncbi:MAG: hypothetical protein Q9221_004864 [Calogaya cf. arnoldii]